MAWSRTRWENPTVYQGLKMHMFTCTIANKIVNPQSRESSADESKCLPECSFFFFDRFFSFSSFSYSHMQQFWHFTEIFLIIYFWHINLPSGMGILISCSRHQNIQIYEFRTPNILFTCLINSGARHSAIYKLKSRNLF